MRSGVDTISYEHWQWSAPGIGLSPNPKQLRAAGLIRAASSVWANKGAQTGTIHASREVEHDRRCTEKQGGKRRVRSLLLRGNFMVPPSHVLPRTAAKRSRSFIALVSAVGHQHGSGQSLTAEPLMGGIYRLQEQRISESGITGRPKNKNAPPYDKNTSYFLC